MLWNNNAAPIFNKKLLGRELGRILGVERMLGERKVDTEESWTKCRGSRKYRKWDNILGPHGRT